MSYFLWACEEWMSWAIPLLEPSASLRQMRYVKHDIHYCYMLVQEARFMLALAYRTDLDGVLIMYTEM